MLAVGSGDVNTANNACPSHKLLRHVGRHQGNTGRTLETVGVIAGAVGIAAVAGGLAWHFTESAGGGAVRERPPPATQRRSRGGPRLRRACPSAARSSRSVARVSGGGPLPRRAPRLALRRGRRDDARHARSGRGVMATYRSPGTVRRGPHAWGDGYFVSRVPPGSSPWELVMRAGGGASDVILGAAPDADIEVTAAIGDGFPDGRAARTPARRRPRRHRRRGGPSAAPPPHRGRRRSAHAGLGSACERRRGPARPELDAWRAAGVRGRRLPRSQTEPLPERSTAFRGYIQDAVARVPPGSARRRLRRGRRLAGRRAARHGGRLGPAPASASTRTTERGRRPSLRRGQRRTLRGMPTSVPPISRGTVRQGGKEELRASVLKTYLLRVRTEKGERVGATAPRRRRHRSVAPSTTRPAG